MKTALLFLLALPMFAAVSASAVWEIRSTATAGNVNGCGFVTGAAGTDYSQQDTAQYTFTDLASANGTTNPAVVTSASHSFITADEGNIIHVTAGTSWTTGWYQIVSTSGGAATLDRAVGTAATLSGGTFYVGGACSLGASDATLFNSAAPGNTFWVKNGTYTTNGTVTITVAGTNANPVNVIGYNTTRGDNPTDDTRPLISLVNSAFSASSFWNLRYLRFTGTYTSTVLLGSSAIATNIKVTNLGTNRIGVQMGTASMLISSDVSSYRGTAVTSGSTTHTLVGNYLHDSVYGYTMSSTNTFATLINNVILGNVTTAVQISGAATSGNVALIGNTLYGASNNLGSGVTIAASHAVNVYLLNNIISGFVTGVDATDASKAVNSFDRYNAYYNNTANANNWTIGATSRTNVDPAFTDVGVVTVTDATASSSAQTITKTGAFGSVVAGRDSIYIYNGGTGGVTIGQYGITAATADTLTLDLTLGADSTGVVGQIITGRNMAIGPGLKGLGFPGQFPGGLMTGYMDPGAVQRQEAGSSGSAIVIAQ